MPQVTKRVLPGSDIFTDELRFHFDLPKRGCHQKRIRHAPSVFVSGDVHTNTIEGSWSLPKGGTGGACQPVSAKYPQGYLNE